MDEADALEELFRSTPEAFVETRTRLAAALAAAGSKDAAQALKKVRRPSATAWATNQVVRGARPEVDAVLAASERLRGSQGALAAGHGERGLYQADVEELRRATTALAAGIRRVLDGLGRADARAIVDGVLANARAAALTDEGRRALLAGRLVADLEEPADAFGGLLAGGATMPPAPRPAKPAARAPDARAEEARRREAERARALDGARRDEATALATSADAATVVTSARAALDEARRGLEDAQRTAREAERALAGAEGGLRAAERAAAEAETRAGRATRHREALEP